MIGDFVSGVVLVDHIKCLDWQARKAEFVTTIQEDVLEEVVQKLLALVDPQDEE
jgi:mRNA interferase MazF